MSSTTIRLVQSGFTDGQANALEELFPEVKRNPNGKSSGLNFDAGDPRAPHPYYHFHGYAGDQIAGDSKFFDRVAGNHGVRGVNLSDANMFANAGFVSTVDPTGGNNDTAIRIPNLCYDYLGGEKLILWWLGKGTPEGADVAIMGDGTGTGAANHGLRFRMKTTGTLDFAMYSAGTTFSAVTDNVIFNGALHSFAVVLDSGKYGLWSDEVYNAAQGEVLTNINSGVAVDLTNLNTWNIGGVAAAPGSTDGAILQTRALAIIRLPVGYPTPSVYTLTEVFKQLRVNPSRYIASGAF